MGNCHGDESSWHIWIQRIVTETPLYLKILRLTYWIKKAAAETLSALYYVCIAWATNSQQSSSLICKTLFLWFLKFNAGKCQQNLFTEVNHVCYTIPVSNQITWLVPATTDPNNVPLCSFNLCTAHHCEE
jgi:hypothetical protein